LNIRVDHRKNSIFKISKNVIVIVLRKIKIASSWKSKSYFIVLRKLKYLLISDENRLIQNSNISQAARNFQNFLGIIQNFRIISGILKIISSFIENFRNFWNFYEFLWNFKKFFRSFENFKNIREFLGILKNLGITHF
jgi:hypothetical protein